MTFNLNDYVRVKMTDYGRQIHQVEHRELNATIRKHGGKGLPYNPPDEDADGWSQWQLWRLMELFGPYIHMGCDNPFQPDIDIPKQR